MKNKSIAIVGLGNSFSEYILAKIRSEKFDEVWAINAMSGVIYHDKCSLEIRIFFPKSFRTNP